MQTLNTELDQKVVARTREIERLAEQDRYAAVVRERLKIARDLHDTLANSIMATLAEIRLLKRVSATDPGALAEELARAEEALRSVERHARATRVALHVRGTRGGRALTMTIADNGVGFDTKVPYPGHYGLAGLREQAQLIGAVLAIDSAPEQGTTIAVELALAPGMDS